MTPALRYLLSGLAAGLLLIACIVALQVSFFVAQAADAFTAFQRQASDVLAVVHAGAVEQRRYHKALARSAAIDAARLGRLIENTDRRLERVTQSWEALASQTQKSAHEAGQALRYLGTQTDAVGYEIQLLLASSRGTMDNLERLAANPALGRAAANLERATGGLDKTTAAAAEAAEHLRDALSPRRKGFWRAVFEWLLPRPTIPLRP